LDDSPQKYMTAWLVQRGVSLKSLDAGYGRGSAWACFVTAQGPRCGPGVIGEGRGASPGVVLRATPDGAYDGVLDVGTPTFSPPAAVPMTREQQDLARSVAGQLAPK
jgi:hypothetical protein